MHSFCIKHLFTVCCLWSFSRIGLHFFLLFGPALDFWIRLELKLDGVETKRFIYCFIAASYIIALKPLLCLHAHNNPIMANNQSKILFHFPHCKA